MKKLLAILLLSPLVISDELNLICEGVVDQVKATSAFGTTTSSNQSGALSTNIIGTTTVQFESTIFLNLDLEEESGTLEVSENMRRNNAKILKTNLTELKVSDKKLSGRAKFNTFARHKFNIDRRTGDINYKFPDAKFNGSCRKNDIVENKF
ncbi:hypothetical protein N9M76_00010 [Gammaproteobacteria bacterium]|nr:hypothetical protein [Gammaproteobacteria bacterium]